MDDDPVIQTFDLYTTESLVGSLNVVQYVGGSTDSRISTAEGDPVQVQFKSKSGLLNVRLPLQVDRPTYSVSKATELHGSPQLDQQERPSPISSYVLSGFPAPLASGKSINYDDFGNPISRTNKENTAFFVCAQNKDLAANDENTVPAIFMTPVDRFITLRPQLDYLDEADSRSKSFARRQASFTGDPSSAGSLPAEGLRAVNVTTRRRETSEQTQARLSSYAHLQKQIIEEPWNDATLIKDENCASVSSLCPKMRL